MYRCVGELDFRAEKRAVGGYINEGGKIGHKIIIIIKRTGRE